MARVPIPFVPETWQEKAGQFARGSVLDITWKLFVLLLFAGLSALLLAAGPYGAAVGGILLGTLLSDEVRKSVADVWYRRWAEVKLPL